MNFYNNYIALCNRAGKTPSAAALEIGLAKPTITKWKNGGGITDATAAKVARYFGVSIETLLGSEIAEMEAEKSAKKEPTVAMDDELSKKQLMLVDFARSVPADKVDFVLKLMKSIVEDDD